MTLPDTGIPRKAGDAGVLAALLAVVVFGGANPIAIHFSNQELQPLYGAALRFVAAAALTMAYLGLRHIRLPSGSSLGGAVAFGVLVATGNALAYWAILQVPAAIAALFLAAVPLVTMLLAAAHRLEPLRMRGGIGGLLAVTGIAALSNPDFGADLPLLAVTALLGTVICASEAGIVAKKFPSHHPAATNGLAMSASAVTLLVASLIAGDTWIVPTAEATWLAIGHLSLLGTAGLFGLYLFVLQRWSASATAYSTVLMPVVAVVLGIVMLGQVFTAGMVLAAGIVLAGVYIGALSHPKVPVPAAPGEEALAQRCSSC